MMYCMASGNLLIGLYTWCLQAPQVLYTLVFCNLLIINIIMIIITSKTLSPPERWMICEHFLQLVLWTFTTFYAQFWGSFRNGKWEYHKIFLISVHWTSNPLITEGQTELSYKMARFIILFRPQYISIPVIMKWCF